MSAAPFGEPLIPRRSTLAPGVVLLAGVTVLAARPFATAGGRVALFAASYVAIGAASIALPMKREHAHLPPMAVLSLGAGAVALAVGVAGEPVPWPASAWTLPLAILAAVAEEALFRGAGYVTLARVGQIVAIVGSAALFALVHLPAYGVEALPVDFGAGLLFGWQRWASGTWTIPAATHAAANVVAVLR